MNTTMADRAEQRLDAQIAEALFGQPGMSKMDVANRVRELRGDGRALLVGGQTAPTGQIDAETLWWLQGAIDTMAEAGNQSHACFLQRLHDTLSAQPSPGGQGALPRPLEDLRDALQHVIDCADGGDGYNCSRPMIDAMTALGLMNKSGRGLWSVNVRDAQAVVDALAARQPVGQITDTEIDARLNALYREMVDCGQHNGGMSGVAWDRSVYRMASNKLSGNSGELGVDAARPPVGQEPVAYIEHFADKVSRIEMTMPGLHLGIGRHPVYATPPAQQRGEPVAWMDPDGSRVLTAKAKADASGAYKSATAVYTVPLYPPAQAVDLEKFTDEDVKAWVERNDLGSSFGSLTDARCAFDDARSAHLIAGQAVGNG